MKPITKKEGYETVELADEHVLNAPGAQVQIVRFTEGKYEHYHKRKTEFFYFLSGSGKLLMNGNELHLCRGVSIIIPPKVKHAFVRESKEPLEAIMFKTNSTPEDTFSD